MTKDITRPNYYEPMRGKIAPVLHLIESMNLNHHEGNIVKYICRYKQKGGLEDLLKARWCLNRLIRQWRSQSSNPEEATKASQSPTDQS